METTGQSLLDFWNWAARKGLVPVSVANDLRAASKEVLGVEDNWVAIDIKNLDVDYLMVRFDNLRKSAFKPQSLSAYKSRFRKARKLYLSYLDNPSGWHYPAPSSRRRSGEARSTSVVREGIMSPQSTKPVNAALPELPAGFQRLEFPVRPGLTAKLELPLDLTKDEAGRLAAYLQIIIP